MKSLYLSLSLLLVCSVASAPAADNEKLVKDTILHLQPNLDKKEAKKVAKSIYRHSSTHGLDWRVVATLLAQESGFRRDPNNCGLKNSHCKDLGIAQINWRSWGKKLNLSKTSLIRDSDYSIEVMCKILAQIKDKHGKEKRWYTRYHSSTRYYRDIYTNRINPKMKRINKYIASYWSDK